MKKLIEKKNALKAQLTAMLDKVKNEERAFSDEEQAEFKKLEDEISALDATIKAEERAQNITDTNVPDPALPAVQPTQEQLEERAFVDFLNGRITEMRTGEQNVDWTNNSASIVPVTIANRIIDAVVDLCPILAGADVYHEKGTLQIPKWTLANNTHDVTVGYAAEFTPLTPDSGKFTHIDLGGYLAGSLVLIGKSVINNAVVDVTSFIIRKIAEKTAQFIEHELLVGSGSSAAQGATKTSNVVTTATSGTITFDDLVKLQSAVKQAHQKNACWTMAPDTFTAVKLLKDTNARPLIEPDATKAFPYILLGKPVHLSDNMPAVGANALSILYGDYSGLSVNFRENIAIEILREVYHTMHAIGIDCWFEFDSKVTDEQKLAVLKIKS